MRNPLVFIVGHSAYQGRNRQAVVSGHAAALAEMLGRGVNMRDAQKALGNARAGSHATASVYKRFPDGYRCAIDTVEVMVSRSY